MVLHKNALYIHGELAEIGRDERAADKYGMTGHKNVSHHYQVRIREAKRQRIFAVKMKGVTVPYLPVGDSVKGLYIELAKCLTWVRESRICRKHTKSISWAVTYSQNLEGAGQNECGESGQEGTSSCVNHWHRNPSQ